MQNALVVVIHGIKTSESDFKKWMVPFVDWLKAELKTELVIPYRWGWIGALGVRMPGFGYFFRRRQTKKLQKWIAKLGKKYPDHDIHIIAHSMGTRFVNGSMTNRAGPNAFYGKIVYMGGVVSSREDFKKEEGHFDEVLNLWSPRDKVVRWSTFGQCGWKGFNCAESHPGVIESEMQGYAHGDYQHDGLAWRIIRDFLVQK